jgi:hypothetical protein
LLAKIALSAVFIYSFLRKKKHQRKLKKNHNVLSMSNIDLIMLKLIKKERYQEKAPVIKK